MYTTNNPKISQHTRTQIWLQYNLNSLNCSGSDSKLTQTQLATQYGVSRQTISKIINRARNNEFTIRKPINHRYLTDEYIKKRRLKLELKLAQKEARRVKREEIQKSRYEHKQPGDLGHIDLKLLPPIKGEKVVKGQKEYLLALVDDCTRTSYFTIIQGKNQYQTANGLKSLLSRSQIKFKTILSDNGKEFKGVQKLNPQTGKYIPKTELQGQRHALELLLQNQDIKHRYTRVRRPQTNGKVERLNRTVSEEFLTKIQFESRLDRVAQLRLWEYYYNQERVHQGIKNLTPYQKLIQLSPLKFM
jgi:transposase InsO family protein